MICFFGRKKSSNIPNIKIYGNTIKNKQVIKYLGVNFDADLTFKPHITQSIQKDKS